MENITHEVDSTTKTLTISGLIMEALGVLSRIWIISSLNNFRNNMNDMSETFFSKEELVHILDFVDKASIAIIIFSVVTAILFIVDLILFYKLLSGKLTDEHSAKVYLYQSIWGFFNIIMNPVVGIAYLVSGIRGRKGIREESNQRPGI